MYVYNKTLLNEQKFNIQLPVFKGRRRLSTTKKITKSNKNFLRSLGLEINNKK